MPADFVTEQIRLEQRTRALKVGATKPPIRIGGFGRSTDWHRAGVRSTFIADAATDRVYWRVRADVVYFHTQGNGIIIPVGGSPLSIMRFAKPGRPSRRLHFTAVSGIGTASLVVSPDGNLYFFGGTPGSLLLGRGFSLG